LAKPINEQILKFGRNEVEIEISKSIIKCSTSLGIELDNIQIQTLTEDLIDVYKWDSIEDIQICLRNGRQGKYGTTYNKLNMVIIQDWMSKHLEEKAIAREHQYNEIKKHTWESKEEYMEKALESSKQQTEDFIKEKEAEKENHRARNEFYKWRLNYIKNANPEGTIKK